MYFNTLLAFTIVTLLVSLAYFYMFSKHQERFMKFWGMAWVVYSVSLLCLILFIHTNSAYLLEIRKIIDMLNILLLLLGVLAFMHIHIPTYWYRFSLYMVILAGVCTIYRVDLLSFYLPISVFQMAITIVIIYNILRYWTIPPLEKIIAMTVFLIWGAGKSLFSMLELSYTPVFNLYITEVILSNILNFCILTIYIQYSRKEVSLREHLYQTVVENASDAIFYYKLLPYEAFEYVSPSITPLTGYSPAMFYQNPRLYVDLVKPTYLDEVEDVFHGNIQQPAGNIFEIVKKDGSSFWGEINSSIIRGSDDHPVAVEGILRDITEMKSSQLAQIEAKQSRDLLLSYISHELRTPVTSIAGYLTAMSDGILSDPKEQKEAMDIITSKTLLLKKLIDDLDQLSKLETHQFSFDFMTFTAKEVTDFLLHEHQIELREQDTQIQYSPLDMNDCWIIADLERINQVFTNLISNALKYSSEKPCLQLAFFINTDCEVYVASVTNHSNGIKEKDLSHVFDRFYRGAGNGTSGRGLGLTISKEIIQSHNGELTVKSSKDNLTTFTFTIPLFKEVHHDTGKDFNH